MTSGIYAARGIEPIVVCNEGAVESGRKVMNCAVVMLLALSEFTAWPLRSAELRVLVADVTQQGAAARPLVCRCTLSAAGLVLSVELR